jgi:DNA ligase-1
LFEVGRVLLHELVGTSAAVARASSRLVKIAELAALLQRVTLPEVEIGVSFLSGEPRQGRIGIGASVIREAKPLSAAPRPALSLIEVDNVTAPVCFVTCSLEQPPTSRTSSCGCWSASFGRVHSRAC